MMQTQEMIQQLIKYFLEGLAVAIAAYVIPKRSANWEEIAMIGATAGLTFFILDTFAPSVGAGARLGKGFKIGTNLVGAPQVPQVPIM